MGAAKDCLNLIIDSVTREDFIPSMAYGSKVITTGMFRVCAREFTELPIVATSQPNQGKVWDTGKKALRLSQEICEHAKAIVCLHVSPLS
ncbi:hypothetical protein M8C21_025015 [Ambrosia artemisiifolia]|uniref:Uncharacterized protein n=1 Tax=Ambrosia artemisiifolia TaxID=4212 RepID=A0AAD5BR79_AMBAR|nr:hypothetical protein M8C21_025015 [Ambrosia artemisiifolia]